MRIALLSLTRRASYGAPVDIIIVAIIGVAVTVALSALSIVLRTIAEQLGRIADELVRMRR